MGGWTRRIGAGLLGLCLGWGLLAAPEALAQFSMAEQFSAEVITNAFGETMPVRVWRKYRPKDLPVPVVVLLHGSGECGQDNAAQLAPFDSLYKTVLVDSAIPPALYLLPQCTQANAWVRTIAFQPDYRLPRYPAPALKTVKEYLDELVRQGVADPERLYIGGYSLGGFGTWDAIERWPNYFAAAVPVCGGGSTQEAAVKAAATTSVWAFHGSADSSVPVDCTRRMIAALSQVGVAAKYSEYPNAGHNIWSRAFGDTAMLRWLFRQRRGQVEKRSEPGVVGAVFGQLLEFVKPE